MINTLSLIYLCLKFRIKYTENLWILQSFFAYLGKYFLLTPDTPIIMSVITNYYS